MPVSPDIHPGAQAPESAANRAQAPLLTVHPRRSSSRMLRHAAKLLPLLALAGCMRTYTVPKTIVATNVMDATLDQLLSRMNDRYEAVKTLNLSVDIDSSTGGAHAGTVKQNPALAGYILLRKPADLHVIMLAPVIRSRLIEMLSDGKQFKLLITPPTSAATAIEGSEVVTTPSKNGLENLRPSVIRDSLLIPPVTDQEYVTPTISERTLAPAKGHKEAVEEPDYDLNISQLSSKANRVLERKRVIHISRVNLLPYEQDIYANGHIVQIVLYDKYQKFGDIDFPTVISISRPLDEYTLKITINKLKLNEQVDDEQFTLDFPEGVKIRKM